jgi:PAS domain S-box-containing protein
MSSKDNRPCDAAELRKRAEELADEKTPQLSENIEAMSPEAIRQILHELRAHQIELEMQNEELLRIQANLNAARERYFDFYNLAPVGFCSISKQGLITETNLTVTTMLCADRTTIINQPFTRFIHKEDQDTYYLLRKLLFKSGEAQTCELRMLKMDGKEFWVHLASAALMDNINAPVCHIVLSDITERKQAEEALRASEEKYRTVADFTYDWEAWRAPDGTYRYVSPSCKRITEHTAAEFLADPNLMIKITHPEDQSKVIEHIQAATHKAQKQDLEIDFRILTINGEIRWISHMCTAVYGEGGQWLGRRESNRNITKRKQAEAEKEKLEVQNRQLQKAESLGRMAGAIAHHFNNQLHIVMGNLELAVMQLPIESGVVEYLTDAKEASRKAAEMSTLMLTYLGQTPGKYEPIDLSEVCRQSLILLQATAPKGTLLKADFLSIGPVIRANADQIIQVLTNLVTNAWESADENRRGISLTVKMVSQADIPASNRFPVDWQPRDPAYACLEVADAGCGIAEEKFEKIFDPFFSTKFTGRGLGLPVVLGIVRAHHGTVTLESEPDRGSIFRVFFPVTAEEVPRLPEKAIQIPETEKELHCAGGR